MGSCLAKDVIDRGMSWVGYTEGPGENENFFGKELSRINYFNGDKSFVEWCLSYLCYIVTASCFTDDTPADDRPLADQKWDGLYFTYQPSHDNLACGARYAADYFRENDAFYPVEEAQPGDWIFFGPRGAETHGELVRYIEDGRIYTVGGNKNNQVQTADYSLNYKRISGVGRPRYDAWEPDEELAPEPVDETITVDLPVLYKGIDAYGEVLTIQALLKGFGFTSNDFEVNGIFDESTRQAVMNYQEARDLEVCGIVNAETWNRILK